MKSIDIMKTENGFNIITNGGGSILLNGEEILTLDSYLDKVYPKEIEFVFPSGFHPGEKIGGDWTCVAEDVVLPMGNSMPVKTSSSDAVTGSQNRVNLRYTSGGSVATSHYLMSYDGGLYNARTAPSEAVAGIYFSNLVAEATRTKLVSIWKRT